MGGLNVDGPVDVKEGSFVVGFDVDGSVDKDGLSVEGFNVGGPEDDEGSVRDVGGPVCIWQLPLIIETSSMAKSPVQDDPTIPSNITSMNSR